MRQTLICLNILRHPYQARQRLLAGKVSKWRNIWNECYQGRSSLVAATVLTHLAIRSIYRAEQEFFETFLPHKLSDELRKWIAVLGILVDTAVKLRAPRANLLEEYHTKRPKENEPETDNDAQVKSHNASSPTPTLIAVYNTLWKFVHATCVIDHNNVEWLQPVLSAQYSITPGEEDPITPEDDRLLTQLLLDLQLLDYGRKLPEHDLILGDNFNLTVEDVSLKVLRPVWSESYISVTSVATAQIMLDIHASCKAELPHFLQRTPPNL
jgi:hypothetical protein